MSDESRWVEILDETEDYRFGNLFRVIRTELRYRRFDGAMSAPITRISFERGDSVGVLLYNPADDTVLLVRQFRYPVYAGLSPEVREGDGAQQAWLLEIVAGVQDADLTVREVANKELLEEVRLPDDGTLQRIATIYPSPGGSSERIHLLLGQLDHDSRHGSRRRDHGGRRGHAVRGAAARRGYGR